MDHDHIEQFDIVDRYLMGKLFGEESEQFEEHLIDCPQCIDQLQTARNFKQGLRLYTVQEASNAAKGPFFLRLPSPKTWAIVAGSLLATSILILLFAFSQIHHLQKTKATAERAATDWQRRYDEQQQQTASSDQQHQETENNLRGQLQQRETELQQAHQQSTDSTNGILAAQPDINPQIQVLSAARSGEDIPEVKQSRTPKNLVILIPLEGKAEYATYSASIFANQRPFKEITGLKPDKDNVLSAIFNSSSFPPGEYHVVVKGVPSRAGSGILGNYPFRVTRHP